MENGQTGIGCPAQVSAHKVKSFKSILQQGWINFPQVSWNGAATRGLGAEWGCIGNASMHII